MKKHQEYCEIVDGGSSKLIICIGSDYLRYGNGDIRYFSSFGAEKYLKKNGWTKSEKTDLTGLSSNWRPQSTWIKQQKYCNIVEVFGRSTVIVNLGLNKYLQDENEEIRHFPDFLDAANYLSKDGWYLSQIYSNVYGSSSYGTSVGSSAHWIMAKEVED